MKTIIITNSQDVTVDLLINEIGTDSFIRINYDRPFDWQIKLSGDKLEVKSSISNQKYINTDIEKCIWRKPFLSEPKESPYDDIYFATEWKYLIYEIFYLLESEGKKLLNAPMQDYQFSKHQQSRIAINYFTIATAETSINIELGLVKESVAKSLSGKQFSSGNVLYTVDVSGEILDASLWTIQSKITRSHDLTIAYVHGEIYAFELQRNKFTGVDWRKEIFNLTEDWKFIKLEKSFEAKIKIFMKEAALNYGRLDFLCDKNGSNPVFLEVNRNGQWAWLDLKKENGLFKRMCDVYNPKVSIYEKSEN